MSAQIVVNDCYGGFSLSFLATTVMARSGHPEAIEELAATADATPGDWHPFAGEIVRHDPRLVAAVQQLGDAASGSSAALRVVTIDGDRYKIEEYDGSETVVEPKDVNRDWIVVRACDLRLSAGERMVERHAGGAR